MFEDLAVEAGKMRGMLERLKVEVENDPINHFNTGSILAEIFVSHESMKVSLLLAWESYIRSLPSDNLMAIFVRIWGDALSRDPLDTDLSVRLYKITDARYYVNDTEHYDDRTLRRVLRELISSTDRWLALLDKEIFQPQAKASGPYKAPGTP